MTSLGWLLGSMTRAARRVTAAIAAMTLVLAVMIGVTALTSGSLTARVGQNGRSEITLTSDSTGQDAPAAETEGVELIDEEDVPLAAAPTTRQKSTSPVVYVAFASGFVITFAFFWHRIHRLDRNISAMHRKLR